MGNLKELIEENYSVNITAIEKRKNSFKLSDRSGRKCFKQSKFDMDQFQFIIDGINHMVWKNCESVLPVIKTRDGKDFIKTEEGYGFMTEWIHGREADYSSRSDIEACTKALAMFHLYSRGFDVSGRPKGRVITGKWIERFEKRIEELLLFKSRLTAKERKSEFDRIYDRYFEVHYRQALKSVKDLRESCYEDIMKEHSKLGGLCHHDTANHNFIITDKKEVYMIDYDYMISDSCIHDAASIVIRNLRHGSWNRSKMDFILNAYSRVNPLKSEELRLLYCFMEFPQDFWQIGLQYYVEKIRWSEEAFIKKLKRTVNDSGNRFKFINSIIN